MKVITIFLMVFIGSQVVNLGSVIAFAETTQAVSSEEPCPRDLSSLHDEMENVLKSVRSQPFKTTMRASMTASIPEAIQQADGITRQLRFIQRRILDQDRSKAYGENVARKAGDNMTGPLKACLPEEKGSYCEAVEQYYIAIASNIANHGFMDALECFQRQGVR